MPKYLIISEIRLELEAENGIEAKMLAREAVEDINLTIEDNGIVNLLEKEATRLIKNWHILRTDL